MRHTTLICVHSSELSSLPAFSHDLRYNSLFYAPSRSQLFITNRPTLADLYPRLSGVAYRLGTECIITAKTGLQQENVYVMLNYSHIRWLSTRPRPSLIFNSFPSLLFIHLRSLYAQQTQQYWII